MTTLTNATLTIKDLPLAEEMDREAMAAVRGGTMTLGEAFHTLRDIGMGKCDITSTGKTYVCYP